jgi:hypothetical protein
MRAHTAAAAARVLAHYGRAGALLPGGAGGRSEIREATHAFAYYVLKAAAWRDLPGFLRRFPPWGRGVVPLDAARFLLPMLAGVVRGAAVATPGASLAMTPRWGHPPTRGGTVPPR